MIPMERFMVAPVDCEISDPIRFRAFKVIHRTKFWFPHFNFHVTSSLPWISEWSYISRYARPSSFFVVSFEEEEKVDAIGFFRGLQSSASIRKVELCSNGVLDFVRKDDMLPLQHQQPLEELNLVFRIYPEDSKVFISSVLPKSQKFASLNLRGRSFTHTMPMKRWNIPSKTIRNLSSLTLTTTPRHHTFKCWIFEGVISAMRNWLQSDICFAEASLSSSSLFYQTVGSIRKAFRNSSRRCPKLWSLSFWI